MKIRHLKMRGSNMAPLSRMAVLRGNIAWRDFVRVVL